MKKKKTIDQLFPCHPKRILDWDEDEKTGRITVYRPKYYSDWAKKLMSPFLKNDYFSVRLDDLGSSVWRLCDGEHTVEEIGRQMAAKFGPEIEPIYERLVRFLMQLYRGKFIEIHCPCGEDVAKQAEIANDF